MFAGRRDEKQRALENTQRNDLALKDNARADSRLKMEQAYQQRKFSTEDQKEVEGLLAEYHDALDTGDAERVNRATAMLKRFGMDVQSGSDPKSVPDLKAFTGRQALPTVNAQPNPIDDAIQTELKSREALRAKNAAPEQDLPQGDFEEQLINGSQAAPSRYEENGKTTPEFKAMLPQSSDEPEDLGDVDDPAFKAAAAAEGTKGNVIDLDAGDAAPLQIGQQPTEQAQQPPPRLSTQRLPTIISKGGKVLEEPNGAAGRYSPMVAAVFEPFTQHENPELAAAGKRAQTLATKLVNVDGISPKQAIEMAGNQMKAEMMGITNLERTKIGSRPRFGGTGGTGLMGKTQDIAESAQLYDDNARMEAAKIQEEDRQYESIEAAATSGDPALQRDAVNQLLKIRSGSAVTASEDARISQINGLIAQVQDRLGRWTGGAMTPEMARTIQQIVSLKRQVSQAKIKRIYDHQAKLYQAQNRGKTKDPSVLEERANVIREGANVVGNDPNAHLWE